MNGGIFEDAEQDFAALVDSEEALSRVLNNFGSEGLSVLDKGLLDDFEHLIGATPNIGEKVEHLSQLLQGEVSVKALVDELLFNELPEFVVLEGHRGGTLDEVIK